MVTKILRYAEATYAEWSGDIRWGEIFWTLSQPNLKKLYALAEANSTWAETAQLDPAERDALNEAIRYVTTLKVVNDGEDSETRGFSLWLTIGISLSTWRSDLIALGG